MMHDSPVAWTLFDRFASLPPELAARICNYAGPDSCAALKASGHTSAELIRHRERQINSLNYLVVRAGREAQDLKYAQLKNVKRLRIVSGHVTGEMLQPLKHQVTHIWVDPPRCSGTDLDYYHPLASLTVPVFDNLVSVRTYQFSPVSVSSMRKLRSYTLRRGMYDGAWPDEDGFKHLSECPNLTELHLVRANDILSFDIERDPAISSRIWQLTSLTTLCVAAYPVNFTAGVAQLTNLKRLEIVTFNGPTALVWDAMPPGLKLDTLRLGDTNHTHTHDVYTLESSDSIFQMNTLKRLEVDQVCNLYEGKWNLPNLQVHRVALKMPLMVLMSTPSPCSGTYRDVPDAHQVPRCVRQPSPPDPRGQRRSDRLRSRVSPGLRTPTLAQPVRQSTHHPTLHRARPGHTHPPGPICQRHCPSRPQHIPPPPHAPCPVHQDVSRVPVRSHCRYMPAEAACAGPVG